jgi:predicted RNA-binding protein (TIGR00451 family)
MNTIDPAMETSGAHAKFSADVARIAREVFGSSEEAVLEALSKPVRTYYVRCNTLKISPRELIDKLERRGLVVQQNSKIPEAIGISFEGPFEVPLKDKRITVDKHTAESVLQGANVYAPGILKCESARFGDDVTIVSELGEAVGAGKVTMSTNDILTFRKGLAVRVDHHQFVGPDIRELPEFSEGLLYPQSLAAMVTAHVLDPKTDETIVDMNCAPGGKLSHISQLMDNSGRALGFDRNPQKIGRARQTLANLGCKNTVLSIRDSRYLHEDLQELRADRLLIDPPCSALGLRPKIYDFTTMARISALADYQKQFIKSASKVVKPGGVIVYSVCTFTVQECEEVVKFAAEECGLQVIEQNLFLGSKGLSSYAPASLLCQRFHPHTHEIGYFIAKFMR